jgi:predicted Zn-dependent peptidase
MEFKLTTLDNGLRIAAEINPDVASMAMGFFCLTGSRDETPEVAGVSHFLEHMMFKGTDTRGPLDINREFDEIGADYNASTSEEMTNYYAAVLPEFQDRVIDLWSDMMRPKLDTDDFTMEKEVILDEIARYEDVPYFRTYVKSMSVFFAGHPLANDVLGSRESIGAMTAENMRAYFERQYSPGNLVLGVAGNFDHDRFVASVNERCGSWQPFDVHRDRPEVPGNFETVIETDANLARQHMVLGSRGPSRTDKYRYAASVFGSILGSVTNSRLYYALVEPAIADEAMTYADTLDGAGAMLTYLSCDPARAGEARDIYAREIDKLVAEGPTEAEVAASVNKIATGVTLSSEMPMGRMMAVGGEQLFLGTYSTPDDHLQRYLAVTAKDIHEMIREFDISQFGTVTLGPAESL